MLSVDAVEINQNGTKMYITKIKVKEIKELFRNGDLIVKQYCMSSVDEEVTYQRRLAESKRNSIKNYFEKYRNDDLIRGILPGAIILNVPEGYTLRYRDGKLELSGLKFHIVDGQHRLFGLNETTNMDENEVPLTIIENLEDFQEAAQFLIINTTQTKVRSDLTLSTLYRMERKKTPDFVSKLKTVLDTDAGRFEATYFSIDLNNDESSPWRNLILRPNEKRQEERDRGRKFIPINQAGFVETLRFYCSKKGPMSTIDQKSKLNFLYKYWNAIKSLNREAFSQRVGHNYIIAKGIGVGPINVVAPLIYNLEYSGIQKCEDSVQNIFTGLKREKHWTKDSITFQESSQKGYRLGAERMVSAVNERLLYFDKHAYAEYSKKVKGATDEYYKHILGNKAKELLSPLQLRAEEFFKDDINEIGCYCLVDLKEKVVYVGQTNAIRERFKAHKKHKTFQLYAFKEAKDDDERDQLESLSYHFLKKEYKENYQHPGKRALCYFCHPKK